MDILHLPSAVRKTVNDLKAKGKTVGFVPTMGALHEGHASLVRRSVQDNDFTVASIFVNPTQFGEGEDFDKYPRDLEKDADLLRDLGTGLIFAPGVAEMYPEGKGQSQITFNVGKLGTMMDGEKRPGHFQGVVQVVSKLFNAVQPDRAYFGQKDFQQQAILKTLGKELLFPIEIIDCPIVRDQDGLALSSRNIYLGSEERKQALFLSRSLKIVKEACKFTPDVALLKARVNSELRKYPLVRLEYFEIRRSADLELVDEVKAEDRPVALTAAFLGKTRLIDNMYLFD